MGVEVAGIVVRETDNAILLDVEDQGDFWIPKSLTENLPDTWAEGEEIEFEVEEWFAVKEGIV